MAKGPKQVTALLGRLASDEGVPALARKMIGVLASQLEELDSKLKAIEQRLLTWRRQDQTSQCLATIPGIGPIAGVSFALKVPDAKAFRSGRALRLLAGHHTARGLDRRATKARPDQPRRRRGFAAVAGDRGDRGDPRRQAGTHRAMAFGLAGAQAEEAGGGRAGQQDGPHRLGHDGERRDLPLAGAGLNPPTTETWHIPTWQG